MTAYRTDLDGLRGVAIALVACFHIWFGRVSGGVDVFLTLSGYFFVGSLLRHAIAAQAPHVNPWRAANPWPRFTRLARRLLPALLTVLIAASVLTLLVLPQTRWLTVGREVMASALYYQNWHLALNSQDYTAASSANSPLQHLWSMSVQGQFFLVTMLTALAMTLAVTVVTRRLPVPVRQRAIRWSAGSTLLGVLAVSFYWAQLRAGINQPFNYYDTLARVWEPLAGGLLAIWMPRTRMLTWLRTLVGITALAVIVTCGWWINGVESYPGPSALVPVLATLAIIWSGAIAQEHGPSAPVPAVNHVLSGRWPVWLGSISYALYLWHWPLLIFYLAVRGKDHAGVVEGVVLLAVSAALAWVTKRFVEDPLRVARSAGRTRSTGRHAAPPTHARRAALLSYSGLLTSVLVIGASVTGVTIKVWEHHVDTMVVDTTDLDPAVYPGGRAFLDNAPVPRMEAQPTPLQVLKDLPITSYRGDISSFTDDGVTVGVYGDTDATRTVALAGGSHAEHWITALDAIGKRDHVKVTTYLKMGCPLSSNPHPTYLTNDVPYPQCRDWVQQVMHRLTTTDKPDAVFTNTTRPRAGITGGDIVPDDYTPILRQFSDADVPVLGIRDTVWPHHDDGTAIDSPTCLAEGGDPDTDCASSRRTALSDSDPTDALVGRYPGLHPLDLSNAFCDDTTCPAVIGNVTVYHDWHHLSATFVRSLIPELSRQMRAALPWT